MPVKKFLENESGSIKRFLPLLVLLFLIIIIIGLGGIIKGEKSRLLEEKSNAVIQDRPPVNVVEQELIPGMLRDRLNLPGILEPWESLGILAKCGVQL